MNKQNKGRKLINLSKRSDDVPNYNMLMNDVFFFNIWVESDHTFTIMFSSPEFKKLIISDRRPNICKTIFFMGFRNHLMVKSPTFNRRKV